MSYFERSIVADAGSLDLSGANTVAWSPGMQAQVKRVIFVTTTALTSANATVTVAVRKVDNTSSTTVGSFVAVQSGSALNDVSHAEISERQPASTTEVDGSTYIGPSPGMIEVDPDEEIAFTSNGGPDAGAVEVYVEYVPISFDPQASYVDAEMTFTVA